MLWAFQKIHKKSLDQLDLCIIMNDTAGVSVFILPNLIQPDIIGAIVVLRVLVVCF